VINIGGSAFSGCSSLKDVTVEWATPLSVPDDAFTNEPLAQATLHVPFGIENLYKTAEGWQNFGTILEAEPITDGPTGNCSGTLTGDDGNYTLTISGNGTMGNYTFDNAVPWSSYRNSIKTLTVI
jgi:hypothetical protein